MSAEIELFLFCIATHKKQNPLFINAIKLLGRIFHMHLQNKEVLRNLINDAVREFLINTSFLYKQMVIATKTEMVFPGLPQKYMYFKQLAMCPHSTPAEGRI